MELPGGEVGLLLHRRPIQCLVEGALPGPAQVYGAMAGIYSS